MYKPYSLVLGLALAGCAGAPPHQTAPGAPPVTTATASAPSATPIAAAIVSVTQQPSGAPVKALNMAEFGDDGTRCEEVTRPGSRIIVARRCRTIIPQDESAAFDEGALSDQLNQVGRDRTELNEARREQKELERSARRPAPRTGVVEREP